MLLTIYDREGCLHVLEEYLALYCSVPEALLIVALGTLIDTAVQATYLVAALKARRLISTSAHMRLVNRAAASMIGGCALLVARRS